MVQSIRVNLMHFLVVAGDRYPSHGTHSSVSRRNIAIRCDVFTPGLADVDVDVDAMHSRMLMMISLNANQL